MTGPAIETTDLAKRYGATVAVAGISLRVDRGEVFGFLGPNGAGKSTTVKLLLGLARPTGGSGSVLGRPIGDREARRRIGYLPELFRYQSWLSAREVLALHCELVGIARERWPAEIEAGLALVGLEARAGSRVGTFSKGMQQRLGLAVALVGSPELVFLDEPTSALDPIGRIEVREIIGRLAGRGTTVFLDSHLLTEVERVCDRVAIVDHGRVVATGTVDELTAGDEVAVRVTGLPGDAVATLAAGGFGAITATEEGIRSVGIDPERVPDLVAALVALGGRVHAVEPARRTLEERFFTVLHASTSGTAARPVGSDGPAR